MSLRALVLAASLLAATSAAASYRLAPFMDDLFAYPKILDSQDDGDFLVVQYDKARDLHKRDLIPEQKVQPRYVSPRLQHNLTYGKDLKFIGVGDFRGGARAIVIYIHGQGGNRFQGANDWTFGGNFSRIMNLMDRNNGAYISPDFTNLGAKGTADIKSLVLDQAGKSPRAAIFVACGSQGGSICWDLIADPAVARHLAGLLLLGSGHDEQFLNSPQVSGNARPIPIYIGHGTYDPIFPWQDELAFYKRVRARHPGYPIRYVAFDTGVHGTPIRMTDWRLILNWMLEKDGL